jgi:phosphatidylglycerophosphatase A
VFVATAAYSGYFPIAPGTVGSLVGLLVYGLVRWTRIAPLELAVIAVVVAAGVWAATAAERFLGCTDPGPVVIDEVAGMLITLAFVPVGWASVLTGFLIFRVMDIVKPFPAGRLERLPGGWGVMADDVMAGIYANLGLRLVAAVWPGWFA